MRLTPVPVLALLLTGCASAPSNYDLPFNIAASLDGTSGTLVVGMDDGTAVQQSADLPADVCVRSIPLQVTMCYTKGSPRVDPRTNEVVGHSMVSTVLTRDP
ncbi:MAG: hypothetical protein AAGD86_04400 [Pseudomonadota bacterium]